MLTLKCKHFVNMFLLSETLIVGLYLYYNYDFDSDYEYV